MLEELSKQIKEILLGDIRKILLDTRSGSIQVVEEKSDGDSATIADIKIGELLVERLPELLPDSIVINEEDFNRNMFENFKTTKYVWIVDPIDGTKAFRTAGNNEYCVAVALLEDLNPVLSVVYAPEYEFAGEKGLLFETNAAREGATLNGNLISASENTNIADIVCINHVHKDTCLNSTEKIISEMCSTAKMIRAFDGHSTLINYALVSADKLQRVFTRRGANVWDVVQSAYILEKTGGIVFYEDGTNIFPLDISKLQVQDTKLLMPFNIACHRNLKDEIIGKIREEV
ncbi:MAG: inositol monophosphatase family protein [Oscillospiraceae bacterium]|nr:inositol monophosphatase family protein [Oscillospiraceae bacterium]